MPAPPSPATTGHETRRLAGVIVAIAWASAAVFALVVLGFCGYEIRWKLARLRADVARLETALDALTEVQASLTATLSRLPAPARSTRR
jgi:hypothetical protein